MQYNFDNKRLHSPYAGAVLRRRGCCRGEKSVAEEILEILRANDQGGTPFSTLSIVINQRILVMTRLG